MKKVLEIKSKIEKISGSLNRIEIEKITSEMGYVYAYRKYREIVKIYPNIRGQEVTFIGPDGLQNVGFNELTASNKLHDGKPVWILDV